MPNSIIRNSFLPPLWILTLVAFALIGRLLYLLDELVFLMVVGFCVSYTIEPIMTRIAARGISRPIAFSIICLIGFLCICVLILTALPVIVEQMGILISQFPAFLSTAKAHIAQYLVAHPDLQSIWNTWLTSPIDSLINYGQEIFPKASQSVLTVFMQGYSLTMALVNLALLPFIVYYLSMDFPKLFPGFISMFPYLRRARVAAIVTEIDGYVSAFVRGQIIVCSILFVLYAAGLGILGVQLWLPLAVIAGFGNIIPYLGFLVGIILSTVMALVTFGSFVHVLIVWGIFIAVQALEGTFITPKILGDTVGLHPLIIILAIVAGGTLFGLLGIFLAVPIAAALRVLGKQLHSWIINEGSN